MLMQYRLKIKLSPQFLTLKYTFLFFLVNLGAFLFFSFSSLRGLFIDTDMFLCIYKICLS